MATDKVLDLEVMSVNSSGDISCDGKVTSEDGFSGDVLNAAGEVMLSTGAAEQLYVTQIREGRAEADRGIFMFGSTGGVAIASGGGRQPQDDSVSIDPDDGYLLLYSLPTSDPLVANAVWSNSGVLTLSAG